MEEEYLKSVCKKDHAFFKCMMDLIPVQFYFDKDTKDKLKENRRNGEGEFLDWKLARFDPEQIKTVTQMHYAIEKQDHEESEYQKFKISAMKYDDCSLKSATDSLEELREKLHKKLEALQVKRNSMKKDEWMEKRKIKRKMSKMRNKLKKRRSHMSTVGENIEGHSNDTGSVNMEIISTNQQKPIYNKEGKIVFSKFDFKDKDDKTKKSTLKGKDYQKFLQNVQVNKEHLQWLKKTEHNKAKTVEERSQWLGILRKAEGEKQKDNERLLKRAINRKDKRKTKSKQEWTKRKEKVEKKIIDRQEKRKRAIQKKIQGKIGIKVPKAKKKCQIIAGF